MTHQIMLTAVLLAFISLPNAMAADAIDDQHTSQGTQRFVVFIDHPTSQTSNENNFPDEKPCIKSITICRTRNADGGIITNIRMQFQGGQTIDSCLKFSFTGVTDASDVLSNTSHTLVAINIKTGVMGNTTFVASVSPTGDIVLIKDLPFRLAKAFKVNDIDSLPNYVSKIEGNHIHVSPLPGHLEPFDNSTYVVRLDDEGSLKPVGIRKR